MNELEQAVREWKEAAAKIVLEQYDRERNKRERLAHKT